MYSFIKKINPYHIVVIVVILIIIYLSINIIISLESAIIFSFGLLITTILSKTQSEQLDKLTEVGEETRNVGKKTKDIAETLHTNAETRKNINNFFRQNSKDKKDIYNLFLPVDYNKKTLPLINAADSYAMYVISNHLGVDLDLNLIERNTDSIKEKVEVDCNAILICVQNIALNTLFKFNKIDKNPAPNIYDLPCWFVEYKADPTYGTSYKINVYDTLNEIYEVLESPSERCCIEASKLDPDVKFKPAIPTYKDLGIFGRLSKDDNKYIIISGIHGFGTWVIASFLNNILEGNNKNIINFNEKYNEIFFGEGDFIAVIKGEFDVDKLLVKRMGVYDDYIWTKDKDKWKLVSDLITK